MNSNGGINSYVATINAGLQQPSDDQVQDGHELALDCIRQLHALENKKQFPAKLLVLLTSPCYDRNSATELLSGMRKAFEAAGLGSVPLIGTSVAAVFFERQIHESGALLMCIASRLIDAKVAASKNVRDDTVHAVAELLRKLNLHRPDVDINPMANRLLLTFFPDIRERPDGTIGHKSDELHNLLWKQSLCRIPIAGGTSSRTGRDQEGKGLQFCNWEVSEDTLVSAQIDTGVPLGISLGRGLERLEDDHGVLRTRIDQISADTSQVEEFERILNHESISKGDSILFGEDSFERDLIVAVADPPHDGRIKVLEKIKNDATLQILKPNPQALLKLAAEVIARSNRRVRIKRHSCCFSLICSAFYRSAQHMTPYIKRAIENIEDAFQAPCVGGFVDGEAGIDDTGRSQFSNWSMVGMVIGDELRDRTPRHRGFIALAHYSRKLTDETTLEDAIQASLNLAFETGFPGARLSFVYPDQDDSRIITVGSIGRLSCENHITLGSEEIKKVVDAAAPQFIRTTVESIPQRKTIIGKYAMPILDIGGEVIAVFEVDVGEVEENQLGLLPSEEEVLLSLGAGVGAGLNRIVGMLVANTTRGLDEALAVASAENTVKTGFKIFMERAVKAFGADMGHIRLARIDEGYLELIAGWGEYYNAARRFRRQLRFDDGSPTCEAYYSGRITIVNDTSKNSAHQRTVANSRSEEIKKSLDRMGACANAVLKSEVEEDYLGTINIVSKKKWFFISSHKRLLKSLADYAHFLVKHLEKKQEEASAHKRIQFLLEATPNLKNVKFRNMPLALEHAVSRFCKAARAEYGSLYLFDDDVGKYVLRAHHNWANPRWLNVARFETDGGWLWNVAQQSKPVYYHLLDATKQLYAREMFGKILRDGCQVRAMGLPLRLEDKSVGILALYQKKVAGKPSEFATREPQDLAEAADAMCALVDMLFSRQDLIYRSEIQERHREISDIFRIDDLDSVLKQFCDYMAKEFEATTADLYLKSVDKISKQPHRVLRASSFPYRDANEVLPDNQIVSVLKTGKPRIVRKQVKAPEHGDFNAASSDGLVERICIPISVGPTVQGVLSLKWDRPYDGLNWEYSSYRDEQLRVLGRVIGSAYNRFVLTQETEAERREKETAVRQRERARQRELETMDITRLLIDQRAHFTGNLVRELRGQNALMKAAESHEELRRLVFEMSDTLVEGNKAISRILEDTQIVENSEPRGHDLDLLIHATLADVSKRCTKDPVIEVEVTSNNPKVFVADLVVKHAFRNILDNAIDSIRGRDREPNATRKIYINARSMDNGMAEILFSDTGLGIKPSMIEQLNAGKVKRKGRRGFGVLTYRFFISRQGGTARFSSDGKTGASVRVELPLCLQER